MLNLMYITNRPEISKIAENAGVDWIFIDMEFIGKDSRQGGLDTVKNRHTIEDVKNIRNAVSKSKVLVRVNPLHDELYEDGSEYRINYPSSEEEIEAVILAGADIIMLPFFKTIEEVETFIKIVQKGRKRHNKEVKTCLLLETPEAANLLEQIVEIPGIDMIHIGLNDMHLALGLKFMFQLLTDGSVDKWSKIIKSKGIQFGFGGLASLKGGAVPGEMILKEHYRLGSKQVILSRAFCNADQISDLGEIKTIFEKGISEIRLCERKLAEASAESFEGNRLAVVNAVNEIINNK